MNRNYITELDDKRLDELLAYTPGYSEQNSENISKMFLQKVSIKRSPVKRIYLIAAIAAVLAAFSGMALAASMGLDFGRIINSFFNNPNVGHRVEVGQSVIVNDLEVTLISTVFDDDMAYALVEIRNLEGEQLTNPIRVLGNEDTYNYNILFHGEAIYDEDENKFSLPLTLHFQHPVSSGDTLELNIDAILFGVEYVESEMLDFDVAAHAKNSAALSEDEWFSAINADTDVPGTVGFSGDNLPHDMGFNEYGITGMSLLDLDKMEIAIGGADWALVTNAGIADGLLHLQTKHTASFNRNYNSGLFHLIDDKGNMIEKFYDISMDDYEEIVFDIRGIDLSAIRLAASSLRADSVALGPWNMSFIAEQKMPKESIAFTPADSPYFAEVEVIYSPLATSVWITLKEQDVGDVHEFFDLLNEHINSFDPPYFTLNDRSIVPLDMQGMMNDSTASSSWYRSEYFDVDMLYSLTLYGEVYLFD